MLPARPIPRPTAQVAPYFEVLGAELTVEFLLQFGGAELHFSNDPKGRSAVEKLIGSDADRARQGKKPWPRARAVHFKGASRWQSSGSPGCCTGRDALPQISPAPFAPQT